MSWTYQVAAGEPVPCACCGEEVEEGYQDEATGEWLCVECFEEEAEGGE